MSTSTTPYTEPWLRATRTGVLAAAHAILHALELALDDLTKWTAGLTDAEIHASRSHSFDRLLLRHIARWTDRILTYAEGGTLPRELAVLKTEQDGKGKQES